MIDRRDVPTAEEVEQRLRELSQLYDFGFSLKSVRFLGPEETRRAIEKRREAREIDERERRARRRPD